MSYNERFGLGLLVIACLYMAGLNLWLLFKDWFNERYNRKDDEKKKDMRVGRIGESKTTATPSIVGESKFNQEQEKRKQDQLEREVKELKMQLEKIEENQALFSIPLEKAPIPPPINDEPVSSEEEIILHSDYDKEDAELASTQSFTADEFELMAKSLSGKIITKDEEQQVAQTIVKVRGTDMYQQFIGQVKGAEQIVLEILKNTDAEKNTNTLNTDFDFTKFIRT